MKVRIRAGRLGVVLAILTLAGLVPSNHASGSHQTWSQYRGNAQRTGVAQLSSIPAGNTVARVVYDFWGRDREMVWRTSPVVARDGTVYVVTRGPSQADGGKLYAFTPGGTLKWRTAFPGFFVMATPAIRPYDNNVAVVGTRWEPVYNDNGEITRWKGFARAFLVATDGSIVRQSGTVEGAGLSSPLEANSWILIGFWHERSQCQAVLQLDLNFSQRVFCGSGSPDLESHWHACCYSPHLREWVPPTPEIVAAYSERQPSLAQDSQSDLDPGYPHAIGTTPWWQTWSMRALNPAGPFWRKGDHGATTPVVGRRYYIGLPENDLAIWTDTGSKTTRPEPGKVGELAVAPGSESGSEHIFATEGCSMSSWYRSDSAFFPRWSVSMSHCAIGDPAVLESGAGRWVAYTTESRDGWSRLNVLPADNSAPMRSWSMRGVAYGGPVAANVTTGSSTQAGRLYVATSVQLVAVGGF